MIGPGCGKLTYVEGTNGGKMPCGALLTMFGETAPYFCATCDPSYCVIARWETRGGKHWCELTRHRDGAYTYSGNGCGGCLGVLANDDAAIAVMTERVKFMAPDNAKIGMQRKAV